jgi:hypothetical protein
MQGKNMNEEEFTEEDFEEEEVDEEYSIPYCGYRGIACNFCSKCLE